jgi:predicted short-subunit dehydrogenase-like oxidoreductase (DUF2520 family)
LKAKGKSNTISLIGYGKTAYHLHNALKDKFRILIASRHKTDVVKPDAINNSEIIFICTRDSGIKDIVRVLKSRAYNLTGCYIFHTSGVLNSDILKPLEKKGARVASFHPVQTFAVKYRGSSDLFRGIYIAFEGSVISYKKARLLASHLKARIFRISKAEKIIHHINCVIASNYLCSLAGNIKLGKKKAFKYYYKLSEQTLKNVLSYGPAGALSGPVERNDADTIRLHLNYLKKHDKELLRFYLFMGIQTVKLAVKRGSITEKNARDLLRIFNA